MQHGSAQPALTRSAHPSVREDGEADLGYSLPARAQGSLRMDGYAPAPAGVGGRVSHGF